MRWRSTQDFSLQAWILALSSSLSCLVGLSEVAFGIWLIVFTRDIAPLFGVPLMEVYYGYVAIGAFASLTALLGCTASLLRRMYCLMAYVTLLGASIMFQCTVWAFIHIEQKELVRELGGRISENPDYLDAIDYHYNCQLQGTENSTAEYDVLLDNCVEFASRQLWTQVWAEIGLCATLICLQFVVLVMGIMMIELVRRSKEKANKVYPRRLLVQEQAPQRPSRRSRNDSTLESEITSSTAPFFSRSSPSLSAPPLSLRQFSLRTTPSPSAPPLHHQISALHYSNENIHSWDLPSPSPSITKV